MIRVDDYDFNLPEELIAQHPSKVRDESRLLLYDRESEKIENHIFNELDELLTPDDFLVFNDSKVIPARIFANREGKDEHVEFLLLKNLEGDKWQVMCKPGKKVKIGTKFYVKDLLEIEVLDIDEEGLRIIELKYDGVFYEILDEIGNMPLPPYIHEKLKDKNRYQTVYARDPGSAAAPTAGLHFTDELLKRIKNKNIQSANVCLHVGLGTFRPVNVEDATKHKMHSEFYYVDEENARKIEEARLSNKNIVAVGTTSVRTLESIMQKHGKIICDSGETDIFIYPSYEFKIVDKLITNFHLPKSTLLMLVSALITREKTLEIYKKAIEERYRFFSFGDAMFIR